MRQSMIIWFALCVIGLVVSASFNKLWEIIEKRKSKTHTKQQKKTLH